MKSNAIELTSSVSIAKTTEMSKSFRYACITCLQPNQALYKQYSTAKNIKLETCPVCYRDVDPYIERELLLVIMDMLLMRGCAYRHLFFNRSHALFEDGEDNTTTKSSGVLGIGDMYNWKNALVGPAVCVLLRSLLKIQGSYIDISSDEDLSSFHINMNLESNPLDYFWGVYPLLRASIVEFATPWMGTMLIAYLCRKKTFAQMYTTTTTNQSALTLDLSVTSSEMIQFLKQMNLAIVIPQLFQFVTLFVHIYEKSFMVQMLGSAFVSCFTYMAVCTIMERIQYDYDAKFHSNKEALDVNGSRNVAKNISGIVSSLPFLVGLGIELYILSGRQEWPFLYENIFEWFAEFAQ